MQFFVPAGRAGPGLAQHPETSTQTWPPGQDALLVHELGAKQNGWFSIHTTLPSALWPHSHVVPHEVPVWAKVQVEAMVAGQVLLGKQEPSWQT